MTQGIKKHLAYILGIMIVATGTVVILAWDAMKPISEKSGFNRDISPITVTFEAVMEKPTAVVDVVGFTGTHLYYKTKKPNTYLITDRSFNDPHYFNIDVPITKVVLSRFTSYIDSPFIHVFAGNVPAVMKATPDQPAQIYNFPGQLYMRAIPISSASYIFRGFDSTVKRMDPIFFKGNVTTGERIKESNISETNHDAGISTDGPLHFDKKTGFAVYVYSYKNKFMALDTNLNLIYLSNTIDTFSSSQAKAEQVEESNVITNLLPKRLINAWSSVYDGYLYNLSRVKADNETDELAKNSVIDIYEITTGKYKGSIYVPNHQNQKVTKFKVNGSDLYAVYRTYLVKYSLGHLRSTQ